MRCLPLWITLGHENIAWLKTDEAQMGVGSTG
jgi:hypothetical protein